ncbi:MAG: dihydrolipoyl dehydrogenase [Candidatus Micropelagos sp.]|uniref:Dihydrolipoyl dehydrogenase n=1 Tax=PS1 clade bacterium TaxID=2175152 RepID=A0A368DTR0_9PROT|nr:dihydrolipoyl dehydrogenase [Candidatus Micropelagos sp.]NCG11676.1 dihydrolipoyl dehydrogenase [Alphaproteobacteria bacterium]OUV49437.1 MAG: dihydrolipoyl dehydrogenase [Alphaproteobacteria bacterium TMED110]RCL75227.1 MAG: dihydrolipoyl dehydrogenase [PS1 clade bacterium]RCL85717.1 MAG: dihydrolipoyl dehydrogenase [PS1 clade bacterium]|tara:strand:- start:3445 stop:4860 length:1416 start_codon:yes stop_codon:yes gene_type:complete
MSEEVGGDFDLVVIGSGPGGYVCAIRAAQLGLRVACVDKRGSHGGTCLNIGCIPSKALLHASEVFTEASHAGDMGIQLGKPKLDLPAMMTYKENGITGNTQGIDFLFKKNKVEALHGSALIVAPGQVEVSLLDGGTRTLNTKNIVIATGSESTPLQGVEVDEKLVVSSTGALEFDAVPKHLLIVGAGIIGLELGSVWARLGAEVTVVEYLDRITPGVDEEVSKQFQRILQKQGFKFLLGKKVTEVKPLKASVKVTIEPAQSEGEAETLSVDKVLVSIGRRPYTEGLGLESVGVQLDVAGRIETNGFKTNVDGIYAIGDVITGPMLAHKAEDEGVAVAEMLAGKSGHVNYDVIPGVIYTAPEVAWVGLNEEELTQQGVDYRIGKFPFMANGRAKVNNTTDGFVKVLADTKTDRILGVHIVGPEAGNMIAEAAVAMEFGGSAEDLARTCHAHPTLTEAVKEAALAVEDRAIHM